VRMPPFAITLYFVCLYLIRNDAQASGRHEHRQHCVVTEKIYRPSPLEESSHRSAARWINDYCGKWEEDSKPRHMLLKAVLSINEHKSAEIRQNGWESVLSQFEYSIKCRSGNRSAVRVVEPLYSTLRSPLTISCSEGLGSVSKQAVMNVDYFITTDKYVPGVQYARNKIFIDLGAALWSGGDGPHGGLSQQWLISHYIARGIHFNRWILWEAKPKVGDEIFAGVPHSLYASFQYMNVACTADPEDPANPLNVLRKIANEHDFVVFKLDIDDSELERQFISQILANPSYHKVIDELFWEPHYYEPYLIKCCWKGRANTSFSLSEVYETFTNLRRLGIWAHGWP